MNKAKLFLLVFVFLLQFLIFSNYSFATTSTPQTYSPSCILMEASTGKILYEKNSKEVRFPASTTKIMTAILAVEHCELTDIATVSHNAIFSVPVSYAHASLKEGEQLTVEQLLNVLLIPSANDAANVLAEHISGSVEEFAKLMNEKAKEIGCLNTHFVNPNGIHDDNHITTAYDLALMGQYAMKNSTLRNLAKKTRYTLPTTNKYDKEDRIFNTTNDLLRENNSSATDNYYYPNAIGIKTGYTSEAGSCIIAGAQKDNMEVIVVILGGQSTEDGLSQRYLDCINLFNYAFDNYSLKTLNEQNSILKQIGISGATKDTQNLNVIVKDEIAALIPNNDSTNLEPEITFIEKLEAPIATNSVIGKMTYVIDGVTYSSDLIAGNTVLASSFLPILLRVSLIFVTLYLLYLVIKPSGKDNNNKTYTSKKKNRKKHRKGGNFLFTQML